ncbi:MAG: hypothetical protein R2818_05570 [Flavobacteriales bacterium]
MYTLQWVVDNGPCESGISTDEVTIACSMTKLRMRQRVPIEDFCSPIATTRHDVRQQRHHASDRIMDARQWSGHHR